jgi:hypothetical protein
MDDIGMCAQVCGIASGAAAGAEPRWQALSQAGSAM